MFSPDIELSGYGHHPSLRSRVASALLSLGVICLIILALLGMGALPKNLDLPGNHLTAVELSSPRAAAHDKAQKHEEAKPKPKQAVVNLPQTVPVPVPTTPPVQIIKLTHAEFAASDISKIARHSDSSSGSGNAAQNSGATYGPGEGPGGARLYRAEWYREPSHAELAGYIKNGAPPGSWAEIACQTIDHFHVENCQQLGEFPPGIGLSRALRQAAWQFLIRPPRIDGKPIPGAWVRIHFDFSRAPVKASASDTGSDDTEQ
jgi:hypothetical protein